MDEILGMAPPNTTGTYQQVGALFAALAKAQGAFLPIEKNRTVVIRPREGSAYEFDYADLAEIRRAITPAMEANGLSWHSATFGLLLRTTIAGHGATVYTECPAPSVERDPKQYGALLTYLRRYHLSMLAGIAADDDIDNGSDGIEGDEPTGEASQEPRRSPPPQRQAATGTVEPSQVKWIERKIKALGLDDDLTGVMLDKLKIPRGTAWAALTQEQFKAVQSELNRAGAM
jgi:hypothetical protein